MRCIVAATLALGIAACSTAGGHRPPPEPQRAATPALQRFVVAVQLLPRTAPGGSRAQLAEALERLSGALREAAAGNPGVNARAERIRVLAGELGDRTPSAPPSGILARALREGVDALDAVGGDRARHERARADAALGEFDASRPILAQVGVVRSVLGQVANGLLVSRGLPALDTGSVDTGSDGSGRGATETPGVIREDAARRASELVSRLAAAPGSEFRAALADALEGFADALAPAATDDRADLERLQAIRTEAGRVRQTDVLGPIAAPPAKAALEAVIQALGARTEPPQCAVCRDWLSRARAALHAVHDHTFIAFQRGPLQEACRLVADVLVLAASRPTALPRSSNKQDPREDHAWRSGAWATWSAASARGGLDSSRPAASSIQRPGGPASARAGGPPAADGW